MTGPEKMSADPWERMVAAPVRASAQRHPMTFIEFLIARAKDHPELIDVFADATEDMGRWYQAQAAGLDGVIALRRIVADKRDGGP